MALVKDDLIQTLYDQSGFSKHKSRAVVETVFELVKKVLESGDDVLISGFGKFSAKKKAPRKGRNPATGEDLMLDARTVVLFKCSTVMRDRINPTTQYDLTCAIFVFCGPGMLDGCGFEPTRRSR